MTITLKNYGVAPATAHFGLCSRRRQPASPSRCRTRRTFVDLAPLASAPNGGSLLFTTTTDVGCPGAANFTFAATYTGGAGPLLQAFCRADWRHHLQRHQEPRWLDAGLGDWRGRLDGRAELPAEQAGRRERLRRAEAGAADFRRRRTRRPAFRRLCAHDLRLQHALVCVGHLQRPELDQHVQRRVRARRSTRPTSPRTTRPIRPFRAPAR